MMTDSSDGMDTPITIKQEAYANLPGRHRRQHSRFEYGGVDRGGTPVARAIMTYRYDVLLDMGVFDAWQVGNAVFFTACQEAALGLTRTPPHPDSDKLSQADYYYALVRDIPKKQFKLIEAACRQVGVDEDIQAMRSALYAIAPDILYAFDLLEKRVDEIYACKAR